MFPAIVKSHQMTIGLALKIFVKYPLQKKNKNCYVSVNLLNQNGNYVSWIRVVELQIKDP